MGLELSQNLKLSQNLSMTQELRQAINMLAMNHQEVAKTIGNELLENPFLEDEKGNFSMSDEGSDSHFSERGERAQDLDREVAGEIASESYKDWSQYVEGFNPTSSSKSSSLKHQGGEGSSDFNYENIVTQGLTLAEHLLEQLTLDMKYRGDELEDLEIYEFIIHNINSKGHLEIQASEIERQFNLSQHQVEDYLKVIQRLDPIGCGTTGPLDSLMVQSRILYPNNFLLPKIVGEHLEDFYYHRFNKISEGLGIREVELQEQIKLLAKLSPYPGSKISSEIKEYVVPDLIVRKVGNHWAVALNDESLPKIKVDQKYSSLLKKDQASTFSGDQKDFLKESYSKARWLVKSFSFRQSTIERVGQAILQWQLEYFEKGEKYLRPLILKDLARELELHESTISRACQNKYIDTPHGVLELKYFFTSGTPCRSQAGEVSSKAVKHRLKYYISKENPKKPFSDQKLVQLLSHEGIKLARRTVTKYRESLEIPTSSVRKKLFLNKEAIRG